MLDQEIIFDLSDLLKAAPALDYRGWWMEIAENNSCKNLRAGFCF
jgi:hypothetical protein